MNVTIEEMLQLLGAKETEIYLLRKQIAALAEGNAKAAPKSIEE